MNKDDILNIMLTSINDDNRALCQQGGMSEADTESQIEQSQPSLGFILSNMYEKLDAAGVFAK